MVDQVQLQAVERRVLTWKRTRTSLKRHAIAKVLPPLIPGILLLDLLLSFTLYMSSLLLYTVPLFPCLSS